MFVTFRDVNHLDSYRFYVFVSVGLTVLNKSKWKGGTLRIEVAKESFLHR